MDKHRQELKDEILGRLKAILLSLLKIMQEKDPQKRPKLDWETDLIDDLAVDSLESLDLMNAIENEFDVSPNLSEVATKRKLSQIVEYIIQLQKQKNISR